ncbi:MAG TPA: xanthine dehydrogenase family protein subunit M [Gemmatimonadales bacterium]|nr:xanthine dehydrogenase family protein subunit M [Gemmatimonadales bacterium]
MIPTSFDYVRARTLREALDAVAAGEGTKVIAGGHSLLPMMKFRLVQPTRLVDIGFIAELRGVAEHRKGARIGATTTYRDVMDSQLLRERFPILAETANVVGDGQVRNRGTIGGAVAHADPASDMPAVMLVLDAEFVLRSKRGILPLAKRNVVATEFFQGPFTTALGEGELLTEIILPGPPKGAGMAYVKHTAAASGYALAAAACVIGRTRKTISHIKVATTGVGDSHRFVHAAQELVGTKGEPEIVARVAERAFEGVEIQGDIHAPAEYRRALASVIVKRAITTALERAR